MKLKVFNSETCISSRKNTTVPSIGLSIKSGTFRFNKPACELIGIEAGDQIAFLQDETDTENWYVEKVKDKGFEVRFKENVGSGLLFNNTTLAKQIADSVAFTGTSGKCLIAGKPTEFEKRKLYGILTTGLRNV